MIKSRDESAHLPTSHYYLAIASAAHCRMIKVRASVARVGVAATVAFALWGVGSALYLGFHDDLVTGLMTEQARMQSAYEDRIAALRDEVDQEASQHLSGQGSIEAQLHALSARASTLETRATLMSHLAEQAGLTSGSGRRSPLSSLDLPVVGTGLTTPGEDVTGSVSPDSSRLPVVRSLQAKPHPEAEADPLDTSLNDDASLNLRVAGLAARLEGVDAAQYRQLADVATGARQRSELYRQAIASAGLSPERFERGHPPAEVGGPFVPLDDTIAASPFGHALQGLESDVIAAGRLSAAMPHVPLARPLNGPTEVTSPFGPRLDPFLGRPALHTGVDLHEAYGTDVRATADGRVVSAGGAGGYGNMVEVDHGNGLSTRYAHLSEIAVSPGDHVTRGQVIGEVGATGRATGPHLHYETRIDGEPVDPMRFLEAGQRLAAVEPGL